MADTVELRLGSLTESNLRLSRSGIRWMRGDRQDFHAGDVLGYCNISLAGSAAELGAFGRIDQERLDLQVALVARFPGKLHRAPGAEYGGWHDRQELFQWNPDNVVATITPADGAVRAGSPVAYHFVAGRRASELAEDRSGLLTGWHDRSRAWRHGRADAAGAKTGSVLGLGSCDLFNVLRGEESAFLEMLEAAHGPAQIVDIPDRPLVHSSRIVIEQIARTHADRDSLAMAFAGALTTSPNAHSPQDWIFVAMCLQTLSRSPTSDRYDILTRSGVETTGPADAVVLTLSSEPVTRLRHKQFGFSFDCHPYRFNTLGPSLRAWFKADFERVANTVDDIRRDYLEMARLLRVDCPERQIIVLNGMSTMSDENIVSYAHHDVPLGQTLRGYRTRELNAMLDDIAAEAGIAVVDVDAIGAEMGGLKSVPDGMHQSGPMQEEIRAEILAALQVRRVPGFANAAPAPDRVASGQIR